jgi:hypothetical protein
VFLNPRAGTQNVHALPEKLHGATALSVDGDRVFLYGPYGNKHAVFLWSTSSTPQLIFERSGALRGLQAGRFLAQGEHGFTVLDCSAAG